ncbi:MAG TPA: CRTAC1 family protein, partial [Candidatus Sulfopaludibacter sp.]|nr:CRTAC1 family protein [Candidatus Sulfopaludibacter sp.]
MAARIRAALEITVALSLAAAPAGAPGPIRFEDIAAKAGLTFELRNGAVGGFHQPELMLGGVAALDYNNDGCMDIFFT